MTDRGDIEERLAGVERSITGRCLIADNAGVVVVVLGADAAGGVIGVQGHDGQPRATMQLLDDGRGRIGAMAPDGRTVALGP